MIAPIRQYWLTHIIELIPGDLHYVEKERIEYMIDSMLNEINKDYFDSVRKSILDYILKDEAEMKRLGIQQVLDQTITWGDDFYKGIEPDEEWKHNVMMARMLMSENLCICSQATLELMRIWREKDYYQTLLVNLPDAADPPVPLAEFNSLQKRQTDNVRALLGTEWSKSAGDILREELDNLDKDQTKNFCDSVAALMSTQVRDLVTRSINKYVEFYKRFQKPEGAYPSPEDIINREYSPEEDFEHTFIILKLEKDKDCIKFGEDQMQVQHDLVKVILFMVEKINQIPRPDLGFRNPEQTHLWDIQPDDEIVQAAMKDVKEIIMENLYITCKVINVYDEFNFLLTEREKIVEFLDIKPYDREVFLEKITKYQDTITKIREKMPFEIRMSMFLVECEALNDSLVDECNVIITMMLNKAAEYVQIEIS